MPTRRGERHSYQRMSLLGLLQNRFLCRSSWFCEKERDETKPVAEGRLRRPMSKTRWLGAPRRSQEGAHKDEPRACPQPWKDSASGCPRKALIQVTVSILHSSPSPPLPLSHPLEIRGNMSKGYSRSSQANIKCL